MTEKITRDTPFWGTADGRILPVKCMTDTHLANVLSFVENTDHRSCEFHAVLLQETRKRKLTKEFLGKAPIPWQDVDGTWKTMDINDRDYRVIGR